MVNFLYRKSYINRGHRIMWILKHHYHPQVIDFYTTKNRPLLIHSKFAALIPTYSASSSAPNCSSRTASSSKFRTRAWLTKPSSSLACICLPPNLKRKKSLIQNENIEKKRKTKTSWNNNTISKKCQPTYIFKFQAKLQGFQEQRQGSKDSQYLREHMVYFMISSVLANTMSQVYLMIFSMSANTISQVYLMIFSMSAKKMTQFQV